MFEINVRGILKCPSGKGLEQLLRQLRSEEPGCPQRTAELDLRPLEGPGPCGRGLGYMYPAPGLFACREVLHHFPSPRCVPFTRAAIG